MGRRQQHPANAALSVLLLPWLAHGHISPFLELGKRLFRRGFRVYLCSTPANLASVRHQLNDGGDDTPYAMVEPVELHLPSLPGLPPHLHTTKHLPPHLMQALKDAFDLAAPTFSNILDALRPGVVVYDFLQPWAPAAAASLGIPAVLFLPYGAAAASFLSHLAAKPAEEFPFPSMRFDERELAPLRRLISNDSADGKKVERCTELSFSFVLVKTSRKIEAKYVDYLNFLKGKEHVPVGYLVQELPRHLEEKEDEPQWRRFSAWLDDKPDSSVVFVSFGTEYFLSGEQMADIARGLEFSGVSFIWVVRFPHGEELRLEDALPCGFLERVAGRGMVVEGWAPQGAILAHAAVGGFATHCGWSSVVEALRWGVPMVALPMHLDQPLNAKVVVELGVGVEVRRGGDGVGREGTYVTGEELARVVTEVVAGEEGEGVRRKAKEMKHVLCRKEGAEVDVVAAKLAELCRVADGGSVEESAGYGGDENKRVCRTDADDKMPLPATET
ncbi:hypothetical protein Taro_009234 [Colocasia esculenta]|uniref:Glycosyltransferase N-terminal domain-containing protein n=1 Tax=Colocasia esculenta TaxID=4460 RepID=A0A843TVU7_COLES|nr:hypothetical protein [Colocasia esculenta]